MSPYPRVLGELDTLDQVVAGRSLARFGDTELAIVEGRTTASQPFDPTLATRLEAILRGQAGQCLVGIPNLTAPIERPKFWDGYPERFNRFLNPQVSYVSSFVSRPDIVPWVNVPAYWQKLELLWKDQDVTLVRGGDPIPQEADPSKLTGAVSLVAADLTSARSVTEIIGAPMNAWADYADVLAKIPPTDRVLICLGATATVLAVDLCARGVEAVDLGHLGVYLRRHRAGLPMKRDKRRRVA